MAPQAGASDQSDEGGSHTDPELKAYLDGMRQDLTQQMEGVRQDLSQQIVETRQHGEQLNQETRQHVEQLNQDTRRDLMAHAEQLNRETGVLIEDVRHQVQLVAEGVMTVNEKLDRFHDEVEAQIFGLDKRVMRLEAQRRSGSDA